MAVALGPARRARRPLARTARPRRRSHRDQRIRLRVYLLAAACLEHATTLDPAVREAVEERTATLIPPENEEEARALAEVGPLVLVSCPGPDERRRRGRVPRGDRGLARQVGRRRCPSSRGSPRIPPSRSAPSSLWAWSRFDTARVRRGGHRAPGSGRTSSTPSGPTSSCTNWSASGCGAEPPGRQGRCVRGGARLVCLSTQDGAPHALERRGCRPRFPRRAHGVEVSRHQRLPGSRGRYGAQWAVDPTSGHRRCQTGHGPSSLVAAAEFGNPHGQRSLRPGVVPAGSPGASSAEQPQRVPERRAPREGSRGLVTSRSSRASRSTVRPVRLRPTTGSRSAACPISPTSARPLRHSRPFRPPRS